MNVININVAFWNKCDFLIGKIFMKVIRNCQYLKVTQDTDKKKHKYNIMFMHIYKKIFRIRLLILHNLKNNLKQKKTEYTIRYRENLIITV